jgi:hypothetical protein
MSDSDARFCNMAAWGTGPFDSDTAMDAVDRLVDGEYSFDALVEMFEEDYIGHDAGVEALMLIEATLAARGLRELPEAEGLTIESITAVVDDERAAWLVEHAPRVLEPGSEEFELLRVSQAGTFKKTVVDRYNEEGSRIVEHQTVQGSIAGDVATGSISGRVRIVRPNGQVVRCNFGPQRWRMVD